MGDAYRFAWVKFSRQQSSTVKNRVHQYEEVRGDVYGYCLGQKYQTIVVHYKN